MPACAPLRPAPWRSDAAPSAQSPPAPPGRQSPSSSPGPGGSALPLPDMRGLHLLPAVGLLLYPGLDSRSETLVAPPAGLAGWRNEISGESPSLAAPPGQTDQDTSEKSGGDEDFWGDLVGEFDKSQLVMMNRGEKECFGVYQGWLRAVLDNSTDGLHFQVAAGSYGCGEGRRRLAIRLAAQSKG